MAELNGKSFSIFLAYKCDKEWLDLAKTIRVGPFEFEFCINGSFDFELYSIACPVLQCKHLDSSVMWSAKLDAQLICTPYGNQIDDNSFNILIDNKIAQINFNHFESSLMGSNKTFVVNFTIKHVKIWSKANPRFRPYTPEENSMLLVGDKTIKVNKEMLAYYSPVFKSLFFDEDLVVDFVRVDEDYEEFNAFINIICQRDLVIDENSVESLLKLAGTYEVPFVTHQCEKFVVVTELLSMQKRLDLANQYNLECVKDGILTEMFYTKVELDNLADENKVYLERLSEEFEMDFTKNQNKDSKSKNSDFTEEILKEQPTLENKNTNTENSGITELKKKLAFEQQRTNSLIIFVITLWIFVLIMSSVFVGNMLK